MQGIGAGAKHTPRVDAGSIDSGKTTLSSLIFPRLPEERDERRQSTIDVHPVCVFLPS